MSDYPKIMTKCGEEITVGGAAEEAERRAEGFVSPVDAPVETPTADAPVDPPAESDEPTFGPPHDQTHTKRSKKR